MNAYLAKLFKSKPPKSAVNILLALMGLIVLFWPVKVFRGYIHWIALGLWIAILLLGLVIGEIAAQWAEREEKQVRQSLTSLEEASGEDNGEADHLAFEGRVRECCAKPPIAGYFDRNLVQSEEIISTLVNGLAFEQSTERPSYADFAHGRSELLSSDRHSSLIMSQDPLNLKTVAIFSGAPTLLVLLFIILAEAKGVPLITCFTSLVLIACSGLILGSFQRRSSVARSVILSVPTTVASLCCIVLPYIIAKPYKAPLILFPTWILVLAVGYLLSSDQNARNCLSILVVGWRVIFRFLLTDKISELQSQWLSDCADNIIMPQATLAINTVLGKDKDRLLVEQDSEGLRRLQDSSLNVSIKAELTILSTFSQMDGGSVALVGPRGAGKSTLLKKFSGPSRTHLANKPCISVYLAAPAEYIPRDFIAELFRQLCEAYLLYTHSPLPESIYKERSRINARSLLHRILGIMGLCLRTAIVIALIIWIVRPFTGVGRNAYLSLLHDFRDWQDQVRLYFQNNLYKKIKPFWGLIRILIILLALASLPGLRLWRSYIKPRKEVELAKEAREYLLRLQIDKTITWGANLTSPGFRGMHMGLSRGGSASYTPWTLPELVGHTRRFMQDISTDLKQSDYAIVVGIDEIDRIGSLDHAEKFIGEIKAVFGVERCFFLVAIAEDVGSVFAQRATAGRSIVENAFDDIIVVGALSFGETRDLLLKRVPGFTDSFVYLVHVLSGGLPRELIRVTRRLVDANQDFSNLYRHPRLEDLTFILVKEQLIEQIRASRNQMSRLTLTREWTGIFEKLRSASARLRGASPFSMHEMHGVIEDLSRLTAPESDPKQAPSTRDEDVATRMITDFAAFAFFSVTVTDAFSDRFFDLSSVQTATASGSAGSYEELSAARAELAVSAENSRAILHRFRESLLSVSGEQ